MLSRQLACPGHRPVVVLEQNFLFDRSGLPSPPLLLVGPFVLVGSRLSPASQQTAQSEETQQTPASAIAPDHYGSGDGRAGWIGRRVLRIVR